MTNEEKILKILSWQNQLLTSMTLLLQNTIYQANLGIDSEDRSYYDKKIEESLKNMEQASLAIVKLTEFSNDKS